jgi:diguanylate cyclase (GGDEF)-like protein/PAS domain S-box-containing protein
MSRGKGHAGTGRREKTVKYNYEDILENMHDGVYFVDLQRRITLWNKAAETITGFKAPETIGSACSDNILVHVDAEGRSLCLGLCPLAQVMEEGVQRETEVFLHHKEGHRVPVKVRAMPLRDETGAVVGAVEFFSDNSAHHSRAQRVEELEKLALLDGLTSLSNRRNLEAELDAGLQEMERLGTSFGVLFMDIDHFKGINDTYGHEAGDLTLKTIARTISFISRPYDLFGRWGGEEFVGVIRNVDGETLVRTGERFRALIEQTIIHLQGRDISVTVSMGATLARAGDTVESLVKRADELMYGSKLAGRNRLIFG